MSITFRDGVVNDMLGLCNDSKLRKRLNRLIAEIERDPFGGFAKAEPLKGNRAGRWSKRIDEKHRIVYTVTDGVVEIVECGGHYEG
ncbi:MAG: Txe/YoeB family addiction module toxin [Planctomycetaceae bacterium]|jgi:toxin YoeB|nr:Txe/YoeB family addiction module toxin [Planctomycetaceae bacterium]